jgi:hypothetical protein
MDLYNLDTEEWDRIMQQPLWIKVQTLWCESPSVKIQEKSKTLTEKAAINYSHDSLWRLYLVAAAGNTYTLGYSIHVPVKWGPVSSFSFIMIMDTWKNKPDFKDYGYECHWCFSFCRKCIYLFCEKINLARTSLKMHYKSGTPDAKWKCFNMNMGITFRPFLFKKKTFISVREFTLSCNKNSF